MSEEKQPRSFDPAKHMMKISGRDYLPVAARLLWFREDHPDWTIQTCVREINHEKQYAVFCAEIRNAEGRLLSTGTKFENRAGFADYIEKAESGSVGRALLMLGYGTMNALDEISEGLRLADAPQTFPNGAPAREGAVAAPQANGKAPVPVKPKLDPYAVREQYCDLAKQAGFKDKAALDAYLRQKGIDKLDRVETMARACDLLTVYIQKKKAGEDTEDVWEEGFKEENEKQAVAIV